MISLIKGMKSIDWKFTENNQMYLVYLLNVESLYESKFSEINQKWKKKVCDELTGNLRRIIKCI